MMEKCSCMFFYCQWEIGLAHRLWQSGRSGDQRINCVCGHVDFPMQHDTTPIIIAS